MAKEFIKFNSRRSTVYSTKGIVASSQTLASSAGIKILGKGGNCVAAAIAASAVLCITEPSSTGIGGDCFALYYNNNTKKIEGLNGTGRCAQELTVEDVYNLENDGKIMKRIPVESALAVTVPGAIAGWIDAYEKWCSKDVSLKEILEPAITLAENGFPISEIAAHSWKESIEKLKKQNPTAIDNPFIINGGAPQEGDVVFNKSVAKALKMIAEKGKSAFYDGPIAEAIIKTTSNRSHKLSLKDLADHTSTFVEPICLDFLDFKVWEIPPNGQGLVALIALGIIQELQKAGKIDLYKMKHNSAEYLHLLIEAAKIGFYDSDEYVTDTTFHHIPLSDLLSPEYLSKRAELFNNDKIIDSSTMSHGVPDPKYKSDTIYLTVTDSNGDACSFINSVYDRYGSAIVVDEYGFCLHNRGANFNLTSGNRNCLEGGKRPYHTIIPGLITNKHDNSLYASFGNMGGYMQPVGHIQHVLNMTVFNLTPQESIDSPRFCLCSSGNAEADRGKGSDGPISTDVTVVALEKGISPAVIQTLAEMGHKTKEITGYKRDLFGRAQIIKTTMNNGILVHSGGSDLRGDGSAIPML